MKKYVIENREFDRLWQILEHDTKLLLGTLTRNGIFFKAESEAFRTISSSVEALVCLGVVFRTQEFYHEVEGILVRVSREDFPRLFR